MKKGLLMMLAITLAFTFMFVGAPTAEAMNSNSDENVQSSSLPISIWVSNEPVSSTASIAYHQKVVNGGLYRGYLSRQPNGRYSGYLYLDPHPYPMPW